MLKQESGRLGCYLLHVYAIFLNDCEHTTITQNNKHSAICQ